MASNSKTVSVDDVVVNAVLKVLTKSKSSSWSGTMTDLNQALVKTTGKNSIILPKSPSALRIVLNRVIYRLRTRKISLTFQRCPGGNRTRLAYLSLS